MKIGIFDSGLGGLLITKKVVQRLPQYDYVYLGDTKRVPYGDRSQKVIYEFTKQAVEYLFSQNCSLVILACNSASARALRKIQREFLPKHYPDRKVLGVVIPAVEAVEGYKRIGVLATHATVRSKVFSREVYKRNKKAKVLEHAAPLLVPLIENGATKWADPLVEYYLKPFKNIEALVLGCTHYPLLKRKIKKMMPEGTVIISQDEVVPVKLQQYLRHHPEVEQKLSRHKKRTFLVTDMTPESQKLAKAWFGASVSLHEVNIEGDKDE